MNTLQSLHEYCSVLRMGIQVRENTNDSLQENRHLRTDRSLQNWRSFLRYTQDKLAVQKPEKHHMIARADGTS